MTELQLDRWADANPNRLNATGGRRTRFVQVGANGSGSSTNPFGSVQNAVNASTAGDIILLRTGSYEVVKQKIMSLPKETIERWLAAGFVVIAIVFNLVFLFSEVALPVPPLNDNGLHYPLVARANEALSAKESIFDHWVSYWVMGFPVFHYYQHLPHIFVVARYRALGQRVDLLTLFNWVKYLILGLFPLQRISVVCN